MTMAADTERVGLDAKLFHFSEDGSCHLIGGKCSSCGTVTWGLRAICPKCWAEGTQEQIPMGARGKIYSATTVRHAAPGFTAPYVMAAIDLEEGLRVIARVLPHPTVATRDAAVALEAGPLGKNEQGAIVIGPIFRVQES